MNRGTIFDIHYNAIYDGAGIRTVVFFKGCPLRCKWCHNPESQSKKIEMAYNQEKCTNCGLCVSVCKYSALTPEARGPVRSYEKCVACGECAKACPVGAQEKIGEIISAEKILELVSRDRPFYETSGGGVTFSGGEATMQPDFLINVIKLVRANGILVALETCGFFDDKFVDSLVEHVNQFLFDLKHPDPAEHKRLTGVDSEKILNNLKNLISKAGSERVTIRIPVIPSVNDSESVTDAFIAVIKSAGHAGEVHLMPYNRLARSKWEKTGRGSHYIDYGLQSMSTLENMRDSFTSAGYVTIISNK